MQRGKMFFQENCVQCHGEDGTGLKIDSLQIRSKDLTQIKRSRGIKEFPILEIANIIDGRKMSKAHGTRPMPVWGDVLSKKDNLSEADIKGKMAELIAYLMTIQN
jgi:mono/diheme cytochrome c family protein